MATLVITVIGEDRPGLVSSLADVVAEHGGSWGRSQLAQLAGKFAGIVTVDVPDAHASALTRAVGSLEGLDISVQGAEDGAAAGVEGEAGETFHLDLVGHDHPGIVQQVSGVLARQKVSVEALDTRVVPAPQAGGDLFEARCAFRAPADVDVEALKQALEELAQELQVDVTFDAADQAAVWE
ncbi:glycine cleavage system protein R [Ornithinimicrobium avium]|uniref:Amino acid-binding ACT protein n=1 Tax=Ornithinimicrobium avium TaxID=2283195 RepID=A0A345NRP2_9MICO|nr:ACT domain-containing protein [Ornithinimicrobium avium]AXH97700.1 amino acid-binding ACT protein [Ornithinimicrobium avium]